MFLAAVALLVGCRSGEFDEYRMRNDTDEPIYVHWFADGDETQIGPIPPNLQLPLPVSSQEMCSTGLLVARTASGREVARRTEPLCMDDTWIIVDSGQ